jgi:hypothetical protein
MVLDGSGLFCIFQTIIAAKSESTTYLTGKFRKAVILLAENVFHEISSFSKLVVQVITNLTLPSWSLFMNGSLGSWQGVQL